MKSLIRSVIIPCMTAASLAQSKPIQTVKVAFIEALDPKDSVTSKKFREEFTGAIRLGKSLAGPKLKQCGYEITDQTYFYGISDPIQAKEKAESASKASTWLIVGPRRSNHYLLLVNGAKNTPSVSLMASSDKIKSLGPLHLSMVPPDSTMAKGAAIEAASRLKKSTKRSYVSVIANDCLACKGFSKHFDEEAKKHSLVKLQEHFVTSDQPSLTEIVRTIKKANPAFILVPNYSVLSSHIIASLHVANSKWFYVGGDGWGALKEGFVENGRKIPTARGFSVRGNPSLEKGLDGFKLGRIANAKHKKKITTSSAMTILRIFDSLEQFLCSARPKDKEQFTEHYARSGKEFFSAPWGTSVFELKNQDIAYLKSLTVN